MGLEIYKPNKNITGSGASFSFNSKEGDLFVSMIKQVSWENGKGSFKGGDSVTFKLNTWEIGGVLDSILTNRPFETCHKSSEGEVTTWIKFNPYFVKDENKEDIQKGYGLIVNRVKGDDKKSFLLGFNFWEASSLVEYFRFALQHIFAAIYAQDKADAKERAEKKGTANKTTAPKVEVADEPVDTGEDNIPF
jgi:hypothetical protein